MPGRGGRWGLLDERLAWPWAAPQDDPPWRLGHGLAAVGPGWWPLVRAAFAAIAETPGASVGYVRQKCCLLDMSLAAPVRVLPGCTDVRVNAPAEARDFWGNVARARLGRLAGALREASRTRCEACGRAVPPVPPGGAAGRNHCARCATFFDVLVREHVREAEVSLWEHHAGGVRWPPPAW